MIYTWIPTDSHGLSQTIRQSDLGSQEVRSPPSKYRWWTSDRGVPQLKTSCQRSKDVRPEYGIILWFYGGARGVMVIVVGNGHGDTSSNPGRD